jgi:hypothetical protein
MTYFRIGGNMSDLYGLNANQVAQFKKLAKGLDGTGKNRVNVSTSENANVPPILRGRLYELLEYDAEAECHTIKGTPDAYGYSDDTITVRDWYLADGETLPANSQVTLAYDATLDQYLVVGARECPE